MMRLWTLSIGKSPNKGPTYRRCKTLLIKAKWATIDWAVNRVERDRLHERLVCCMLSPVSCGVCMDLSMKFLRTASEPEVAQGGIPDEARPELGDRDRSVPCWTFLSCRKDNADRRVIDSTAPSSLHLRPLRAKSHIESTRSIPRSEDRCLQTCRLP
jgi:hypothetical protein